MNVKRIVVRGILTQQEAERWRRAIRGAAVVRTRQGHYAVVLV